MGEESELIDRYRFAIAAVGALASMLLIHYCNLYIAIWRAEDVNLPLRWLLLVLKYVLTFGIGVLLYVCFNRSYRLALGRTSIVPSLLAVLLVGANIWTSADHYYFYSLGMKFDLVQMLLDQDNKAVINLAAGWLFGFAAFNKIPAAA